MKLTREQAIGKFRKQYRYIANEYAKGRTDDISDMKYEYLLRVGEKINSGCYLCEYVSQNKLSCRQCPIQFVQPMLFIANGGGLKDICNCLNELSPYKTLFCYCRDTSAKNRSSQLMSILAMQIAELDEKAEFHF